MSAPDVEQQSRGLRGRLASVGTVMIVVVIYAVALAGYRYVAGPEQSLGPPDLGTTSDTIVQVTLEAIHPVENKVDVNVVVFPADEFMNTDLNVVNTDIAVRLFVNEVSIGGDLQTPKGELPQEIQTSIAADGDADNWPFDTYTVGALGADVLVGSGDDREFEPARLEVTGGLNSWDISSERSGPATQSAPDGDYQTITLSRARGPLAFDLGLCLVLLTLPALALFVSIEMLRGRRKFLPPFGTWYAASLFAIVPIRNFMPGAPPPGAWIDQILVLWVLLALTAAMVLYFVAWYRRGD
ncbi:MULTISPECIES: DUF4436 domain-containing protein [Mycobacteriaceae]|uniref:DUF4436 domain-containing protein n=1 Tax=Mycobacteriaceae TaxID=1762 RepID=UPI0007FED92C|nr:MULTISPECIES: DUF4436 domain-containing protein [Mycobacteriaceae]MCK0177050.1 DUF4436 domain-containing protein [Mycolicibacterium sp. F2034L]OBB57662.1 DUF4436 domain-containing protein [Mycobacterium sp. 852013-51886_SCH5428379]